VRKREKECVCVRARVWIIVCVRSLNRLLCLMKKIEKWPAGFVETCRKAHICSKRSRSDASKVLSRHFSFAQIFETIFWFTGSLNCNFLHYLQNGSYFVCIKNVNEVKNCCSTRAHQLSVFGDAGRDKSVHVVLFGLGVDLCVCQRMSSEPAFGEILKKPISAGQEIMFRIWEKHFKKFGFRRNYFLLNTCKVTVHTCFNV